MEDIDIQRIMNEQFGSILPFFDVPPISYEEQATSIEERWLVILFPQNH